MDGPHTAGDPQGSQNGREDADYQLYDVLYCFLLHKIKVQKVEFRSTLVATRPFVSKLPMALAASRVQKVQKFKRLD